MKITSTTYETNTDPRAVFKVRPEAGARGGEG